MRTVPGPPPEPASYSWYFNNGNDAAGGIAAYSGATQAVLIDAENGQCNGNSTSIIAPSTIVPSGHGADLLLSFFAIPNSSQITVPAATTQRWSFHAIGWGIGIAMSDLALSSDGATGDQVATAQTAVVSTGALVALMGASSSGPIA